MTRAFQQQGVEIVWAQETSETAAQVYQYNFPDIPLYIGELQKIDISRIPEFDLLLTSIRAPRFSIAQPVRSKMNQYTEMQKCEAEYLEKIIVYRKPKAVCFTLPVNHLILKQEMIEMLQRNMATFLLKDENYMLWVLWAIMNLTDFTFRLLPLKHQGLAKC